VLGRLERALSDPPAEEAPLQPVLAEVLESLLALAGLCAESLARDAGWYFVDAGRRVERAQLVVRLLRHTLTEARPAAVDGIVLESVLLAGESVITFRRREAAGAYAASPPTP
jgi:uncharacterized alpha-E superfamily protein